jgi:hypothetical protein
MLQLFTGVEEWGLGSGGQYISFCCGGELASGVAPAGGGRRRQEEAAAAARRKLQPPPKGSAGARPYFLHTGQSPPPTPHKRVEVENEDVFSQRP